MALGTIKPSQKDCHKDTGNQYSEICDRLHLTLSIILSKKIKYGFYIKVTPVAGMGADAKKGTTALQETLRKFPVRASHP